MPQIDTQTVISYLAWNTSDQAGETGDNANHTLKIISDGEAASPSNSPSEIDAANCPGIYKITITAGENNGDLMMLAGKSSTSDVVIYPIQWSNKENVTQVEGGDATDAINAACDTALSDYGGSTHSAAAVWAVGTRTLTSFGTLVTQFLDGVIENDGSNDITLKGAIRLIMAVLFGTTDGAGTTTPEFKSLDGSKTRVSGITNLTGERSSITLDQDD